MQFKKNKTILSAILAAAMTCSAILPTVASADYTRQKPEAYGDSTYAERFMSLYDDVITNGVQNGYLSDKNTVSGGLGVPYHSVETLCIEAPDYGHETTSEAMSYLAWVAAMRDNIVNKGVVEGTKGESIGDLAKAWKTIEATLIPDTQADFMHKSNLEATYSDEWGQIEQYPTDMDNGVKGRNPIHQFFCSAYGTNDKGLYLMHWLADVDDWYGFGSKTSSQYKQTAVSGPFTMINTFQRGEQESCWETIPHGCIEELKYGILPANGSSGRVGGMKGFFNTEGLGGNGSVAQQFSYTNAPDAEDRAIQAVYAANRWGVGNQNVDSKWGGSQNINTLAGKMGDELRNNMYDKYYIQIGASNKYAGGGNDNGKHYLRNWYTSWGGALDGSWAWQIGCSHSHEFYQNPLAAYALLYDNNLNSAMKAQNATADYQKSFQTQMELYLWLLSSDGPIAGGCTNSWNGRYEQSSGVSKFNGMSYLEHPVYADPGSNHWIGNQVWAVQRLAELYHTIKQPGAVQSNIQIGGMSLDKALETILDKWIGWFMDNTILGKANETKTFSAKYEPYDTTESEFTIPDLTKGIVDDGKTFSIPASLIWEGQPNEWNGSYQENTGLKAIIVGYGDGDFGCVSSLANSLIHYASAKGVTAADIAEGETLYKSKGAAASTSTDNLAKQSLYLAKELLDREWNNHRDDIGVAIPDHNTNLKRLWETKLVLPNGSTQNGQGKALSGGDFTGKMPNGDTIKDGVAFVDIRSNYKTDPMYLEAEKDYQATGTTENYYFTLHRFWHAGDIMMALGYMSELYPDLKPAPVDGSEEDLTVDKDKIEVEVGKTDTIKPNKDGCTFKSDDESVATVSPDGTVTGVKEGTATITVTDKDGNTVTVTVTVKDSASTTTTTEEGPDPDKALWGDVNVDDKISLSDVILLNKYIAGTYEPTAQGKINAACDQSDDEINFKDTTALMKAMLGLVKLPVK